MLHPSDSETLDRSAVRDGRAAPVTCAACGCRLQATDGVASTSTRSVGRDARGCRVDCADAAHDAKARRSPSLV